MSFPIMDVQYRVATGKGPARRLRALGLVPGIVYGPGIDPVRVAVEPEALSIVLSGERKLNTIIEMRITGVPAGSEKKMVSHTVVVRDRQLHPLRVAPQHVDFYTIAMDREMFADVPLEFVGTALGQTEGGLLQVQRRSVTVRCVPDKIPPKFVLDITELKIGDTTHALDIEMPAGVRPGFEHNFPLISCVPPEAEEVVAPTEAEIAAAVVEGAPGEAVAVPGETPEAGKEGVTATAADDAKDKKDKKDKKDRRGKKDKK